MDGPDGVPELAWFGAPGSATRGDGWFVLDAGAGTNRFVDPFGMGAVANAPLLGFETTGDFVLQARVAPEFGLPFDAGGLAVIIDEDRWASCSFEASADGSPVVVSVVNDSRSDHCTSAVEDRSVIHLRVARIGSGFAFHYSTGGAWWRVVRMFSLGVAEEPAYAAFSAHSPAGSGCAVRFSDVVFEARTLDDPRSGH